VWGSTLVLKLMERLPIIITLGAALLGYLGGAMIVSDSAVAPWLVTHLPQLPMNLNLIGMRINWPGAVAAVGVVALGTLLSRRNAAATPQH
ncbi:MAG: TerC family protein, partial [Pseudomonadota bacterium]|nr:TerC family protein [Pseudomonadota bacterium]